MNEGTKRGLQSKLIAMEYFANSGYYVYNELNNTGPVDFVAIDKIGKEVVLLEVKTFSKRSNGWKVHRSLKEEQKNLGVKMCYVDLDNREVVYRK